MDTKKIRQEIIDKYNAIPERQISVGLYLKSVGTKWVKILNTWDGSKIETMDIETFYNSHL